MVWRGDIATYREMAESTDEETVADQQNSTFSGSADHTCDCRADPVSRVL